MCHDGITAIFGDLTADMIDLEVSISIASGASQSWLARGAPDRRGHPVNGGSEHNRGSFRWRNRSEESMQRFDAARGKHVTKTSAIDARTVDHEEPAAVGKTCYTKTSISRAPVAQLDRASAF